MFNKHHYLIIAKAIKFSRAKEQPNLIPAAGIIRLLSFQFSLDNPRFNAEAFRKACGEEE